MKVKVALAWALSLILATSIFAGISVDHDKTADFSRFKSFSIREATPAISPLMRARLIEAIEGALLAAGLEKASGRGDLEVVIHISIDKETRISSSNYGYGGYRGWGGWGGWGTTTVDVREVAIGTLMLDMVDVASEELVWRGIATNVVPSKNERIEKKIRKGVEKLFRHFPPDEE